MANGRREAILKAHPEIRKLFGPCPWTKYKAAAVIFTQVGVAESGGPGARSKEQQRGMTQASHQPIPSLNSIIYSWWPP